MSEHVILVALDVVAPDRPIAHRTVTTQLQRVPLGAGPFQADAYVDSWWVAEDDRTDGSDNDSAVFVPMGSQPAASRLLHETGVTPEWNVVPDLVRQAALNYLHGEDPEGFDLAALADALGVDHADVEGLR